MSELALPRHWSERDITDQTGRRYLITGATSGLGLACAAALRRRGAYVILGARSEAKAEAVLKAGHGDEVMLFDLADLSSVAAAAATVRADLDVVILNAGVMRTPFTRTVDGFEQQMAVNHLGHFALAGLLRNRVRDRFVTTSSLYHRRGAFGDASAEDVRARCTGSVVTTPGQAYGASKLAALLFMRELQRRRVDARWPFIATCAHPGWARTELFANGPTAHDPVSAGARLTGRLFAQSPQRGALPTLAAATVPGLSGGQYFGPAGPGELRGSPRLVGSSAASRDEALARTLWDVSEELTGVRWTNEGA